MRKGSKTFALLAVALLACALVTIFIRKREPSYHGRRLSEWVAVYSDSDVRTNARSATKRQEAAEAIHQMGENAVPWLLAWTDYEPLKLGQDLKQFRSELPYRLLSSQPVEVLFVPPAPPTPEEQRAAAAREAFGALGPLATSAIPELVRRINMTNSPFRRCTAMLALSHLGSQALPAMTAVLSNPNQTADPWVKECVRNLGTNARPLLPLLVQNLQHTKWHAIMVSTRALGNTNFDSAVVVPLLINCLHHPRPEVQIEAPLALIEFGGLAQSALPALSKAATNRSFGVRKGAIMAIQAISSEALTNPPTQ